MVRSILNAPGSCARPAWANENLTTLKATTDPPVMKWKKQYANSVRVPAPSPPT